MSNNNGYFQRLRQLWRHGSLYQRWIILLSGMLLSCWLILMLSVMQSTSLKNQQQIVEQIQQQAMQDENTAALLDPSYQQKRQTNWLLALQITLFVVFLLLTAYLMANMRQIFLIRLAALSQAASADSDQATLDEITRLENFIEHLHKQQSSYQSEMAWARRTGTQLKRLITAQAFLAEWVDQLQQEIPNEVN